MPEQKASSVSDRSSFQQNSRAVKFSPEIAE